MIPRASHKNLSHYFVAQHLGKKPRQSRAGEELSRSHSPDYKTAVKSAWLTVTQAMSVFQMEKPGPGNK